MKKVSKMFKNEFIIRCCEKKIAEFRDSKRIVEWLKELLSRVFKMIGGEINFVAEFLYFLQSFEEWQRFKRFK